MFCFHFVCEEAVGAEYLKSSVNDLPTLIMLVFAAIGLIVFWRFANTNIAGIYCYRAFTTHGHTTIECASIVLFSFRIVFIGRTKCI